MNNPQSPMFNSSKYILILINNNKFKRNSSNLLNKCHNSIKHNQHKHPSSHRNHIIIYIRTFCVYGSGVMLGRRAASGVGKYNAESPKQGSKRFNSITKTIHFAHLVIWVTASTELQQIIDKMLQYLIKKLILLFIYILLKQQLH